MSCNKGYDIFKRSLTFFILCCFSLGAFSQDNESYVHQSASDTEKIQAAQNILNDINVLYANDDFEKIKEISGVAIALVEDAEMLSEAAQLFYMLGIVGRLTEDYSNAINYFHQSAEYYKMIGEKKGEFSSLNQMGAIFRLQGNYTASIEYFFNSLKGFRSISDSAGIASTLNNIGIVHFYQKEYEQALKYYKESLKIEELQNDEFGLSVSYINVGEIHKHLGNFNQALDYYLKALDLAIKHKERDSDRDGVGVLYNEIGSIYMYLEEYSLSKNYLNRARRIFTEINNNQRIAECDLYFGELFLKTGDIDNAYNSFSSALEHAKSINALELISNSHKMLNEVYDKTNNTEQAYYHYKKHIAIRDSLFNEENTKKLVQAEMLYDFEKQKQETKLEQAKKDAIAEEKVRRQIQLRNFLMGGSSLLVVLIIIVFSGYKQKKKNNIVITEKNVLLEQANEEIRSQKDEIEASRDMLYMQKALIEDTKKRMDDSILYAKNIQSAVITSENMTKELFNEYFIIFRPKEVVSGDFYWATKVDKHIVCAVVDCTGHGVPGAFMSMLGISFLNEIVRKKEIIDPVVILEELRKAVIEAIIQSPDEDMKREGMYVNLVVINTVTDECLWSGGRTPLWIFRNNDSGTRITGISADKIEEYKPENPSVALRKQMKDFKYRKVYLHKGDIMYLFTDGIIDQFGGNEGKKFSSKRLKQLISENADKPMSIQKEIIEKALDEWQNPVDLEFFEQVDDITLFGIKA